MAKLRPGRVKIYYVKHFIFDEVVWLSRLVLQKKYINPLLPNGSPFEDLGPHHCVTRPKFWPIPRPRLFIRDKFFRYQYRDFFSETKFSETDTETFFPRPNFPIPIPRLFSETKFSDTDTETFFFETIFSDTDTETTKKLAKVSRPGSLETEMSHSAHSATQSATRPPCSLEAVKMDIICLIA